MPGMPSTIALQRGGDRARVGDVVAEVGAVVDAGDDQRRARSRRPARARRGARSRPACRRSRSRPCRRSKSTSCTHSGRRVVIERAVADWLASGAMTASSMSSSASSARRSACRPSASIPSSLVSSTRSTTAEDTTTPLGNRCAVAALRPITRDMEAIRRLQGTAVADERPLAGRIVGWMFAVGSVLSTLLPLLPGAEGKVLTPTFPLVIAALVWGLHAALRKDSAAHAGVGVPRVRARRHGLHGGRGVRHRRGELAGALPADARRSSSPPTSSRRARRGPTSRWRSSCSRAVRL